jgi:hypothetical protein
MPEIDTLDRLMIEADRDYIHEYFGYWSPGGRCRVRIYERTGMIPVLVLTELPNNENTSVTNLIENLAAEVVLDNDDAFDWGAIYTDANPPFALIEHYPDRFPSSTFRDSMFAESFDYVTFPNYHIHYQYSFAMKANRPRFMRPEWGRLAREKVLEIVLRSKGA